jgi:hypothetical protein
VSKLCPTPPDRLVDERSRPYFLWDVDLTIDEFRERLRTGTREDRAYWTGKLMRQAKPDDVFSFVGLADIENLWCDLERYLGKSRAFWVWILGKWGVRVGS